MPILNVRKVGKGFGKRNYSEGSLLPVSVSAPILVFVVRFIQFGTLSANDNGFGNLRCFGFGILP